MSFYKGFRLDMRRQMPLSVPISCFYTKIGCKTSNFQEKPIIFWVKLRKPVSCPKLDGYAVEESRGIYWISDRKRVYRIYLAYQ